MKYLAVDVLVGDWPTGLPVDEALALPASGQFRLLQRLHQPSGGQLSGILDRLSPAGELVLRNPHPEVLQILDPRPLLDEAAQIGACYSTGGRLVCGTLAAGLVHGRQLWFGPPATLAAAWPRSPKISTSPSAPPNPLPDTGPSQPGP